LSPSTTNVHAVRIAPQVEFVCSDQRAPVGGLRLDLHAPVRGEDLAIDPLLEVAL
jgi:hypothetical protein